MADTNPPSPLRGEQLGCDECPTLPAGGALAPEDYYVSVENIQLLWLSGTIGRTIIAPLDRVKFILQCQGELQRLGTLDGSFRGAGHCMRHLASVEGYRSFWRGNLIQVVSLLPITIAQIFIALPTQSFVFNACPHYSVSTYTVSLYAAHISGALAASMVSYPLDFARFRLAVDVKPFRGASYEYRHSLAFFSQPILSETPHLLYKGLGLYVFGSLLYQTVHNGILKVMEPFVLPETPDSSYGTVAVQVGTGLTVSALSTLCLHPIDTVRRRMMIAATEDDLRYSSSMHCVRHIVRTEGPAGLYRGGLFALVRMVATTALFTLGSVTS
ncbi:mitochondrial carrier protein [Trypanosoma rangeli]|uniref:ADP/ATP translocase n=1 Tax=Trypanosoma rangeli TaxID=5698 RepID=A0A3R7KEL4_TRYRA|nr:mitochondrial carrier protein [Trypanosoma rangeli]RNE98919.1 mitochondrial carrier protein [Trypanosoma rangeli]|eukprot:RNE98919.1 mitochondrial carrier protein [Trypanosoma rangeli]